MKAIEYPRYAATTTSRFTCSFPDAQQVSTLICEPIAELPKGSTARLAGESDRRRGWRHRRARLPSERNLNIGLVKEPKRGVMRRLTLLLQAGEIIDSIER